MSSIVEIGSAVEPKGNKRLLFLQVDRFHTGDFNSDENWNYIRMDKKFLHLQRMYRDGRVYRCNRDLKRQSFLLHFFVQHNLKYMKDYTRTSFQFDL